MLLVYKEPSLSLRTVLLATTGHLFPIFHTGSKEWTHVSLPVAIFAICLWLNLGTSLAIACNSLYSYPFFRLSVNICGIWQQSFVLSKTLQNEMHPRLRYANSYMASSRFVYLPSITFKYFLETFETFKCLACCSLSGRSDFVEYLTDSVPVRNSFLHLQTVLNIIKSLIRPIRPNLPLSSVNICITEFCANFYKSFSFFTILNPFHNHFFFTTVFSPGELKKQFRPLHLLHLDLYQTCLSNEIGLKQSILNRTYPTYMKLLEIEIPNIIPLPHIYNFSLKSKKKIII